PKQIKIDFFAKSGSHPHTKSKNHKLTKALVKFLIQDAQPISLAVSPNFHEFIKELDPMFSLSNEKPALREKYNNIKSLHQSLLTPINQSLNVCEEQPLAENISYHHNPSHWWNAQKSSFPLLSKLARQYLAISVTSTPSKRLFSEVSNIMTIRKTMLKPKLFEQMLFLKRNCDELENIYDSIV
ncbi:7813_t:CDS:2, partial [Gigaspora margarita]